MSKKNRKGKGDLLSKNIITLLLKNPFTAYNYKQISHALGINDKAGRKLVKDSIEISVNEGILKEDKKGKYKLNLKKIDKKFSNQIYAVGKVDMKQSGVAYVIRENENEDIYIAPDNTCHALHGDTVKVLLFPERKGKKLQGEIVKIITRAKTNFVGIMQMHNDYGFVIPDNGNTMVDLFIPAAKIGGTENGDKVLAKMIDWPENSKNPYGEIIEVLGKPGDNNAEMLSILANYDFPLSFSKETEKESANINTEITDDEKNNRRDYREITTFTIDPDDAKDFDDALSLRKLDNGNWETGIHIADVSYYVKPGSAIDKEAFDRGTSVYLVDRVIPMLPEKLSNDICSLRPDEERLCFSAVFEMDENANVLNEWIGKTIIKSNRRFTYDEAQNIIETGQGDYAFEILTLHKLAQKLRKKRFAKGAINFESKEVKFKLDENAKPVDVFVKEMKDSNFLIEEFMLLANKRIAEHIGKVKGKKLPPVFVYRIHDKPLAEKINSFSSFINKLGYNIKIDTSQNIASSYNKLFKQIKGKTEENIIENLAIRTMAKAYYSTENIGHYGLAFNFYTHFTSPIRRYPDLMVHRLLEYYLNGGKSVEQAEYEQYCIHSSEMEKKATEAERDSVKFKQAEYLANSIGMEFEGHISGLTQWGIFVELNDNYCEGMILLRSMHDDHYLLDEENYLIYGQRYGKQYKLGDKLRVKVSHINLFRRQIDFSLVETFDVEQDF